MNAGVGDLNNAIVPGDNVSVLGYSQSATVATVQMNDLINHTPAGVNLSDLHFTLLGDPNSPIGGILDRFQFPDGVDAFSLSPEPQHVPFLDIPLGLDPTPTSGIATDIYMGEYDGWADFPSDPSNLFADLNALIGIETVHPYYPDPTPGVNLDTANIIDLGKIGDTNFYAIPAPLPTLAFMYDGGPAGHFFYDTFSPFATLVDDWGYGNPGDPFVGVNGTRCDRPLAGRRDGPTDGLRRRRLHPQDGPAADAGRRRARRGADVRRPDQRPPGGCRPVAAADVVRRRAALAVGLRLDQPARRVAC